MTFRMEILMINLTEFRKMWSQAIISWNIWSQWWLPSFLIASLLTPLLPVSLFLHPMWCVCITLTLSGAVGTPYPAFIPVLQLQAAFKWSPHQSLHTLLCVPLQHRKHQTLTSPMDVCTNNMNTTTVCRCRHW